MDSDPAVDNSAFFSPSKARAAQAQAKDWASVDAWLTKRYPSKRLPPFERNEETLQALLELAALNDSADEQRGLVDRIEKSSLQAMSRRRIAESEGNSEILKSLLDRLIGYDNLDGLAEMMVSLNCPDAYVSTMARAITDLTAQNFDAERQATHVEAQVLAIKSDQAKASAQLKDLKRDDFEPRSNLTELTAEWTRNTKQLRAKIGEYDDRLAGQRAAQQPTVKLEEVAALAEELSIQQQRLAELNSHLRAYQSVPSDAQAARAVLEKARAELRTQFHERDRLFERMIDVG